MDSYRSNKVVMMILLGSGVFQITAAVVAIFLWLVAGDWRPFWPQIAVIAFWICLPVSHWLWRSGWLSGSPGK